MGTKASKVLLEGATGWDLQHLNFEFLWDSPQQAVPGVIVCRALFRLGAMPDS